MQKVTTGCISAVRQIFFAVWAYVNYRNWQSYQEIYQFRIFLKSKYSRATDSGAFSMNLLSSLSHGLLQTSHVELRSMSTKYPESNADS